MGVGKSTMVGVAALVDDVEDEDGVDDTAFVEPDDDSADAGADVNVSWRFPSCGGISSVDRGVSALNLLVVGTTVAPVATGKAPSSELSSFDWGNSTGHRLHTERSGSQ